MTKITILEHRETAGTNGGARSSTGEQVRTLNHVGPNQAEVELDETTSVFTLKAGICRLIAGAAGNSLGGGHRAILEDEHGNRYLGRSGNNSDLGQVTRDRDNSWSEVRTGWILLDAPTEFCLKQYMVADAESDALGMATSDGEEEIYARVEIEYQA